MPTKHHLRRSALGPVVFLAVVGCSNGHGTSSTDGPDPCASVLFSDLGEVSPPLAASCASFSRDETVVEKDEFGRKTKYEVDWSCSSAPSADCAVAHLSFDVTARTPYGQILSYSYVMTCANTNEETTGTVTKVTYAANGNAYRVEYDVASKSCVLTQ